jgi:uncharacterized protein YciI
MLFVLLCTDKPGSLELRTRVRPVHIAFLNGLGHTLKLAGPFSDDAGSPTGSLVIIEAEDREAAGKIAARDPYAIAGLFTSVDIKAWKWTMKNPEAA